MMRAGLDVVRLNASHGTVEDDAGASRWFGKRQNGLTVYRRAARSRWTQDPHRRISHGKVLLEEGQAFTLDTELDSKSGTAETVGVAYKDLPKDVVAGDTLLLADGLIVLDVDRVSGTRIETACGSAVMSDRKGVNRQGGGISAPAISDKDRDDIKLLRRKASTTWPFPLRVTLLTLTRHVHFCARRAAKLASLRRLSGTKLSQTSPV